MDRWTVSLWMLLFAVLAALVVMVSAQTHQMEIRFEILMMEIKTDCAHDPR